MSATLHPDLSENSPIVQLQPNRDLAKGDMSFVNIWRAIVRQRWFLLLGLLLGPTIAGLYCIRATRHYTAYAQLKYDPSRGSALNLSDLGMMDAATGSGQDQALQTEVLILQSQTLALDVVKSLGLAKDPLFTNSSRILDDSNPSQRSVLADIFHHGLTVKSVTKSNLIQISFTSRSPELSSRIVNALMDRYVERGYRVKYESTLKASDWLSEQLNAVKQKAQDTESQLAHYQQDTGIIDVGKEGSSDDLLVAQVSETMKGLAAATSDRITKEARYHVAESGDPELLAGMMPDTSLTAMHSQLVAVQTEYAAEKVHYGAQWPHIKALKSQMDELNREIQAEVKSDALRLKDEYAASQKTEVALRGEMDRQKGQALDSNKKYIEFEILKREAENSRGLYEGLFRKLQEAGITAGLKSDNVEVVDYAFPTAQPSDPDVKRMMAFGLVAGILFGALIAFVRESLADTIETIEEAELISNLPSIGVIPPIRQTSGTSGDKQDVTGRSSEEAAMHAHADPRSKVAEAFRSLRTAVLLSPGGKGKIKVVAVTSASQGEGKSTTCSNLAIVMAQAGAKVLLIDADMRLGKLRQKHDNNKGSGLSEVLSGIASLEDSIALSNSVDNLSLLFAGTPPPFPSELLASGMQDLLEKCRAKFDFVLVDTPPILAVTDPIIVSTITDRTILVVRPTRTGKRALLRAKTVLESSGIRTLGVVVNAMNIERDSYYSNAYYYGDNANDVYYKGASSDKR